MGGAQASSSGGGAFLTKAEQRAEGTKQDKKESEECFSFLKDVRDVMPIMFPLCPPFTESIYRKIRIGPASPTMIPALSISLRVHGTNLRRLRSRYVREPSSFTGA